MAGKKGKHEKEHADFYRKLRKRIRDWHEKKGHKHKWADYLLFAPDLFYTLVRLMVDPEVPNAAKAKIAGTIAYFISPVDLLPEAILGPIGYLDDMALTAMVLDSVINQTRPEVVQRNWPGDDDVLQVIKEVSDMAARVFSLGLNNKLKAKSTGLQATSGKSRASKRRPKKGSRAKKTTRRTKK